MDFLSTRDSHLTLSFEEAILKGLSDDGGLFMPKKKVAIELDEWKEKKIFIDLAESLLRLYINDETLSVHLAEICQDAFNFEIPLEQVDSTTYLLTLYNGPTLSFKDIGARFLAGCLGKLNKPFRIMVATSGDTGSAVASAFSGIGEIEVIILYPKDKISPFQEAQITCWAENIKPVSVHGSFDDCQSLLKAALSDKKKVSQSLTLTTANSINIGRLLPQMTYFAYWAMNYFKVYGKKPGVIIPSGNLGHMTACFWAKKMGFPIGELVIATNANHTLSDYAKTGEFRPGKTIQTLANAMDVSAPSNFERLHYDIKSQKDFNETFTVFSITDDEIKKTTKNYYHLHQRFICPHTATGCCVREKLDKTQTYFIAQTAHPAKFDTVIHSILGDRPSTPGRLLEMLNKRKKAFEIAANLKDLYTLF